MLSSSFSDGSFSDGARQAELNQHANPKMWAGPIRIITIGSNSLEAVIYHGVRKEGGSIFLHATNLESGCG
jgi:hypothetical protein